MKTKNHKNENIHFHEGPVATELVICDFLSICFSAIFETQWMRYGAIHKRRPHLRGEGVWWKEDTGGQGGGGSIICGRLFLENINYLQFLVWFVSLRKLNCFFLLLLWIRSNSYSFFCYVLSFKEDKKSEAIKIKLSNHCQTSSDEVNPNISSF